MHCVTDGRMKQDQAKALERDASLRSLAELANPFVDGDGDRIGQVEAACLGDAKRATHERRGGMDRIYLGGWPDSRELRPLPKTRDGFPARLSIPNASD
jgi:hypothetical protein